MSTSRIVNNHQFVNRLLPRFMSWKKLASDEIEEAKRSAKAFEARLSSGCIRISTHQVLEKLVELSFMRGSDTAGTNEEEVIMWARINNFVMKNVQLEPIYYQEAVTRLIPAISNYLDSVINWLSVNMRSRLIHYAFYK